MLLYSLYKVNVEHGTSWEESLELRTTKTYPDNGYYMSNQVSLKETFENLFLIFRGVALSLVFTSDASTIASISPSIRH